MSRNVIVGKKASSRFEKSIQKTIEGLSRSIVVYLADKHSQCPNCYYDKVNNSSSGVAKSSPGDPYYFVTGRCPVCKGKGTITTSRKRVVKGLVIWNPRGDRLNNLVFSGAGASGSTIVELKMDPMYLDLLKNCKHVVIDGIVCKSSSPPIIRGLGNKAVLVGEFFTDSKAKIESGERL